MRHALVIALIAVIPLAADAKPKKKGNAKGKKVEFKQHMDAGAKAHKDGKFDVALTELQAAYAIDAQPKLLFAIAQVQAKLDQCPEAVANYEKFLATIKKDKKKTAVVKQAINACNEKIASATAPNPFNTPAETPPPTEPAVTTTPPPSEDTLVAPTGAPDAAPLPQAVDDSPMPPSAMPPPVTVSSGKPWYKDVLGDVLLVGGVAVGVGSIVMYTGARGKLDDAEDAPSLAEYESLVDDAKSQRTLSLVLAGGSAVLITAAVLRYKLRGKGEARVVAVTPTNGGGLVTWSGGF